MRYWFRLVLASVVLAVTFQFTAKTTNSEKAIYFFSFMYGSLNKLRSHILFAFRNFMLSHFTRKKVFYWPSPLPPVSTAL